MYVTRSKIEGGVDSRNLLYVFPTHSIALFSPEVLHVPELRDSFETFLFLGIKWQKAEELWDDFQNHLPVNSKYALLEYLHQYLIIKTQDATTSDELRSVGFYPESPYFGFFLGVSSLEEVDPPRPKEGQRMIIWSMNVTPLADSNFSFCWKGFLHLLLMRAGGILKVLLRLLSGEPMSTLNDQGQFYNCSYKQGFSPEHMDGVGWPRTSKNTGQDECFSLFPTLLCQSSVFRAAPFSLLQTLQTQQLHPSRASQIMCRVFYY